MEQRLEDVEKELGARDERIQKDMEKLAEGQWRLEEMLSAFLSKNPSHREEEQSNVASSSRVRTGGFNRTESSNSFPKVAKLNFPKFDGSEDPISWVCRAEQFFEFQGTAKEDKVGLAAYHLEGEEQLLYQLFKESEEQVSCETLKNGLHVRYGETQFDDFFGDLTKLCQTGTVREYQGEYERLLSRAGRLSLT
jgi:hypothetical protein